MALGHQIAREYVHESGVLLAVTLSPKVCENLRGGQMKESRLRELAQRLRNEMLKMREKGLGAIGGDGTGPACSCSRS